MDEYTIKACSDKSYRRNTAIVVGIVGIFAALALALMVYSFVAGKILFAVSYLIALILAVTFIIIRINSVFATYLATDLTNIYIKNWVNNFLPYASESKVKLISEFIPAKTHIMEIPITEIKSVYLGTKNFIKRSAGMDSEFSGDVRKYETSKDFYQKKTITGMDIIYFETYTNESCYMPIVRFNVRDVTKVLDAIRRKNPDVEIRVSSREYRNVRTNREKR